MAKWWACWARCLPAFANWLGSVGAEKIAARRSTVGCHTNLHSAWHRAHRTCHRSKHAECNCNCNSDRWCCRLWDNWKMRKSDPDVNRTKGVERVTPLCQNSLHFPLIFPARTFFCVRLAKRIKEKLVSRVVYEYFPVAAFPPSLFVVCAQFRYVRKAKGMARRY